MNRTDQQTDAPPGDGASKETASEEDEKPLYKRAGFLVVAGLVLLGVVAGGIYYFVHAARFESTDDAFIDGHVSHVAPQVSGRVERVRVDDNQLVKKGDVLVEIDPQDYRNAVQRAEAALEVAKAKVTQARANVPTTEAQVAQARADVRAAKSRADLAHTQLARTRKLFDRGAVSQQALDDAQGRADAADANLAAARQHQAATRASSDAAESTVQEAQAEVKSAEVALDKAKLDLSRTKVTAAIDGRVTQKAVEPGDYLQAGQQLMALVEPHAWVTANFKETQLTDMRPGQPVTIEVDAYPDKQWKGRVDSFQHGTGAHFSLLPPQNATGNYVKVVQRVPVKIVFDHAPDPNRYLLVPGMSVVPEVDVTGHQNAPMGGHPNASSSR